MRTFRIGSVFGIPIQVDLTFLLILPLFAWVIGSQVELWVGQLDRVLGTSLAAASLTAGAIPWVLGIVSAVGLFVGVVLHELGHSVVAMRYGFPIESITLWIFGGIAQLVDTPEDWRQELAIAVAGPVVSVALGALCYAGLLALPADLAVGTFVLGYLALMNVLLAAFNMLPGFPMDGGRVLRALLARNRPFAEATQIAAEVGKGFALLLGLFGLWRFNIVLIGIAFFIYVGAASEAQQTVMKAAFEGVTVRDVMTPADEIDTVPPDTTIADLVERMFEERHTGYPVMRDGRLVGLVTLEDAQSVRAVERDAFTVEDVMTTDLTTIDAGADAMDAFTEMQRAGIGRLLVEDGDAFAGIVTRSDLMTAFDVIRTSGIAARAPGTTGEEPAAGPERAP